MLNHPAIVHFSQNTGFFLDNLRFLARFFAAPEPGLEKVTYHRYQNYRHWRTSQEVIFTPATETQCTMPFSEFAKNGFSW